MEITALMLILRQCGDKGIPNPHTCIRVLFRHYLSRESFSIINGEAVSCVSAGVFSDSGEPEKSGVSFAVSSTVEEGDASFDEPPLHPPHKSTIHKYKQIKYIFSYHKYMQIKCFFHIVCYLLLNRKNQHYLLCGFC